MRKTAIHPTNSVVPLQRGREREAKGCEIQMPTRGCTCSGLPAKKTLWYRLVGPCLTDLNLPLDVVNPSISGTWGCALRALLGCCGLEAWSTTSSTRTEQSANTRTAAALAWGFRHASWCIKRFTARCTIPLFSQKEGCKQQSPKVGSSVQVGATALRHQKSGKPVFRNARSLTHTDQHKKERRSREGS